MRNSASRLTLSATCLVMLFGCAIDASSSETEPELFGLRDELTGLNGEERSIAFEGRVLLPVDADEGAVRWAVQKQIKTAIGALRDTKVLMGDRDAHEFLAHAELSERILTRTGGKEATFAGVEPEALLAVSYRYSDRVVASTGLAKRSSVELTLLAGDYEEHIAELVKSCADSTDVHSESFWYHYMPQNRACSSLIDKERKAIAKERASLALVDGQIGEAEVSRIFLPVTAQLGPSAKPLRKMAPEYDRLFGLDGSKSQITLYAFLGVDGYGPDAAYDPDDALAQEAVKFLRELLSKLPGFWPMHTEPFAMLLDVEVSGKRVEGVTFQRMFRWILDKKDYPEGIAGNAALEAELRRAALARFAERWIYWELPIEITDEKGLTHERTVQLRTYYGREDGDEGARQRARNRYLEAFWHGDVVLYNGHSHFGHGPLEPQNYGNYAFNERYQLMFISSCLSFNYYHKDFFGMKPGGEKNLELMTHGMASAVQNSGVSAARLVTGLFAERAPDYVTLLSGMRTNLGLFSPNYDPMRIVDGELDNAYDLSARPLSVRMR